MVSKQNFPAKLTTWTYHLDHDIIARSVGVVRLERDIKFEFIFKFDLFW